MRTRNGFAAATGDTTSCAARGGGAAAWRLTMNVRLKTMTTALTSVAVQRITGVSLPSSRGVS